MRTFALGRWVPAAAILGVLSLLPSAVGVPRAVAAEDVKSCLLREADQLFSKLAVAIGTSEIDPATIDDAYVDRESVAITRKCTPSAGNPAPADLEVLRAHMARWSYHLDRKLSEITAKATPD